ncbi:glycosyltransferase family 39 protein [Bryocella elongata]|nr:glycosyltransferase family 39 protein [Bryocella elongata]
MPILVPTSESQPVTTPAGPLQAIRARAGRALGRAAHWCERHPGWLIAVIFLLYVPAVLDASRHKPLWHDELYTYFLANAPTVKAMLAQSRSFDLNPPLIYLATRGSLHLFGQGAFATRLPEMLAFLVALLALFGFVRRRMGALFAFFAVCVVMQSDIFQLATEARPYALMYAGFLVALLAWQKATDGPAEHNSRRWALAVLPLAVAAMLLSHVFSLAPLAALIAAELFRSLRLRRFDWPVLLGLLLPLALTVLYGPLLSNHGAALYPAAFQPSGDVIFATYIHAIDREIIALLLTAAAVLGLLGVDHLRGGPPSHGHRWFFTQAEWFALGSVLALPLLLMVYLAIRQGAFFVRYAGIMVWAVAVLTAALLARWTMNREGAAAVPDPRAALLGSIIVLLMSGLPFVLPQQMTAHELIPTHANSEPKPEPCQACAITAQLDPTLPLVDASGLAFVEMNHRENDAVLSRLYYLTDAEASARIAHANIFERMPEVVQAFALHGHSEPYAAFMTRHRHFFLFGQHDYPEDWIIPKLIEDGARLQFLRTTHDGYWHDTELYEVWLPSQPVATTPLPRKP